MTKFLFPILAALTLAATPALADEPGPGGSKPQTPKTGADVYKTYCQVCHMADAKGAMGAGAIYPALANNPRMGTSAYPIFIIAEGKGAMPWFRGSLTPEQVAMVVTYIRTHFGNAFLEPVTTAEVEPLMKR
jgi:mono/diheme cytochrome c family protein